MTVCKHVITKLPYVNSKGTLSNDTVSMNTGFTLCFAFQRKPEAALMLSSGSASLTENWWKGERGGREALGHQQVVCFYSLFCNPPLAQIVVKKKKKCKKKCKKYQKIK